VQGIEFWAHVGPQNVWVRHRNYGVLGKSILLTSEHMGTGTEATGKQTVYIYNEWIKFWGSH
jgi:hypothetical protein